MKTKLLPLAIILATVLLAACTSTAAPPANSFELQQRNDAGTEWVDRSVTPQPNSLLSFGADRTPGTVLQSTFIPVNKATLDKITESSGLPRWNGGAWPGAGQLPTTGTNVTISESALGLLMYYSKSGTTSQIGLGDVVNISLTGASGTNLGSMQINNTGMSFYSPNNVSISSGAQVSIGITGQAGGLVISGNSMTLRPDPAYAGLAVWGNSLTFNGQNLLAGGGGPSTFPVNGLAGETITAADGYLTLSAPNGIGLVASGAAPVSVQGWNFFNDASYNEGAGPIYMLYGQIKNLGAGTDSSDAVTKSQLDAVAATAALPARLGSNSKSVFDWNQALENGNYWTNPDAENVPPGSGSWQYVGRVDNWNTDIVFQTVWEIHTYNAQWRRYCNTSGSGDWTPWLRMVVNDAPDDGQVYGRSNNNWVSVPPLPGRLNALSLAVADANDAIAQGFYTFAENIPHAPEPGKRYQVLVFNLNNNYAFQQAVNLLNLDEVWWRRLTNGEWQVWQRMLSLDAPAYGREYVRRDNAWVEPETIMDQNSLFPTKKWFGTQVEYDAITTKNAQTEYNIFEE
jgi:hypothetical protein